VSSRVFAARLKGLCWLALTAAGWGVNWPVLKFALTEWPVFSLRVLSSALSVALLLALALARGERIRPRGRGQWGLLALAGVLNITPFVGLGTLALLWLTASEATILAYTMPIWAAMLAWPLLGERPTAPRLSGLAAGLIGVAILLAPQFVASAAAGGNRLPGYALILGNALMFAVGTVLTKRVPLPLPPLASVAWQIMFGTAPMLVGVLFHDRWEGVHITIGGWLVLLYVGAIAMGVCYFAWFRALHLLPATTAVTGALMVPVVGVLSAGWLLGEPVGWRQFLSLGLTMSGVVLASRG
jgi:drug/metabolite transporter (DMT)-like permease